MSLRARIEKLETGRFNEADTVTLGDDLVAASYLEEGDPRLDEFEERCSRSRLGRMLAELDQNVSRESCGGRNV